MEHKNSRRESSSSSSSKDSGQPSNQYDPREAAQKIVPRRHIPARSVPERPHTSGPKVVNWDTKANSKYNGISESYLREKYNFTRFTKEEERKRNAEAQKLFDMRKKRKQLEESYRKRKREEEEQKKWERYMEQLEEEAKFWENSVIRSLDE
ncbi:hypothetical protein GCK72_025186 [Caenorhabditis remanei]|uniref:Uncharacterized protein n=1 Tax=Caenorhabditis remanei TaxID=31234 RepID=A0A6A5G2G4_CAERE|nr:hypothetical protein GCK72_025186 [Caenorhabditis remanei]KAF1748719.1 hypothetical protein GCK72_025186 [Caenorhabditis remanei]